MLTVGAIWMVVGVTEQVLFLRQDGIAEMDGAFGVITYTDVGKIGIIVGPMVLT